MGVEMGKALWAATKALKEVLKLLGSLETEASWRLGSILLT